VTWRGDDLTEKDGAGGAAVNSAVSTAREGLGVALARRAEEMPDESVFTFIDYDDDGSDETLSFSQLHRDAQDIAALLLEKLPRGSRALLLFPPGLDYVRAFYACFQAGIVGVSAPPPQPKRLHRTLPRLISIAADAEIQAVLTTDFIGQAARSFFKEGALAEVEWIATDTAPEGGDVEVARPSLTDLAFLQYTSGSTRAPRGVMLSHENLLSNSDLITEAFQHVSGKNFGLIWLPPYHDMGLIGGILQPVHAGGECILMSPLAVIKRPARWLEAMSRFGATTSGGPNFAYDLCVRRIDAETCERLDLSRWEVAFNGAEPIRPETLEAFSEKFESAGFDRRAFLTAYGLAEATLMVTGGEKAKEPALLEVDAQALEKGIVRPSHGEGPSKLLAGSGSPPDSGRLAVVDAETGRRCRDGEIGEIWFSGPGVAAGYWRNPDETAETFEGRLPDEPDTTYLRTGDLGAILDHELYVVGRIKELLIVNGRNLHPHDIEFSAEAASPLLRDHCGAAFELEVDGEIRIGLLLEVNPADVEDYEQVVVQVRQQVAEDLDLPVYWIGLCGPGTVPKTTSGKIQRRLCKAMLEGNEVDLLTEQPKWES
jgi:acyl-CoA synthetase (AMP-forming)/AMP-acid ligase II